MTRLDNDLISRKALLEKFSIFNTDSKITVKDIMYLTANAPTIEAESGEAVAYRVIGKFGNNCTFKSSEIKKGDMIYISPPNREWKSLSDEEVGMLSVFDGLTHIETPLLAKFIRAIEAKLKEVNGYD